MSHTFVLFYFMTCNMMKSSNCEPSCDMMRNICNIVFILLSACVVQLRYISLAGYVDAEDRY